MTKKPISNTSEYRLIGTFWAIEKKVTKTIRPYGTVKKSKICPIVFRLNKKGNIDKNQTYKKKKAYILIHLNDL